jgi:hypothetical protein
MPNPLEDLTGKNVIVDDVPMPDRKVLEFVSGTGVTFAVTDDSVNGRTVLQADFTGEGVEGGGTVIGTGAAGQAAVWVDANEVGGSHMPAPQWVFDATTTDADPGTGEFRLNVASPMSSSTFLYIADTENLGVTWASALADIGVGSYIQIQQTGTDARFLCEVTGAVVAGAGYQKIPITVVSTRGGVAFTAGGLCNLAFLFRAEASLSGGTADKLTYWSGTGSIAAEDAFTRGANGTNGRSLEVGSSSVTSSDYALIAARGDIAHIQLKDASGDIRATFSYLGSSNLAYISSADTAVGFNAAAYDPLDVTVPLGPETVAGTNVDTSTSLIVSENLTDGYFYRGHYTVTARNAAGSYFVCDRIVRAYRIGSTVTVVGSSAIGTDTSGLALTFSDGGSGDLDATLANTSGATIKARINYSFTRELLPVSP